MKAPPDGYTLLMASTGALMAVSVAAPTAPFDVNKVLAPIAIGAAPPYLLVVNPKLPVHSPADLIRLAKEKPEGLTFRLLRRRRRLASLRPCCSQATPGSSCCTFPTRALVRR